MLAEVRVSDSNCREKNYWWSQMANGTEILGLYSILKCSFLVFLGIKYTEIM